MHWIKDLNSQLSTHTHTYTLLSPHIIGVLSDVLNYVLVHAKDMANARGREMMGEKKAELVETVSLGGSDTADARGREMMGKKKAELVETVSLGGSDTADARGREMMGKKKAELVETVSLGGSDMVDARGRETMGKKKVELELAETVSFGGSKYSSEDVLVACFRFLKALGKNNIQIQRRCAMILQLYTCTCNYSFAFFWSVTYQLLCVDPCPGCMTVWMTCLKLVWQFHTLRTY